MLSSTIDQLARQVDGERLMAHLSEFARWTKHAGTPGELESLRYVRSQLEGYGYQTELILHDAYVSLPGAARIEAAGETISCITQSFSRSSPANGLTAACVKVGAGAVGDFDCEDIRGRIVLVDGIATPAVSQRAGRAGALGQIHFSPSEYAHEMCISPVWGSPGPDTLAQLPTTVVVTVARADGEMLRRILAENPQAEVTIHAVVDTGWRKTPILTAVKDPPDADKQTPFVMFSGHHDTWHLGVMDNGGANATMLEVARLCVSEVDLWKRGLRLYFWSGHSQGRYSSSTWYADHHWEELESRAVAHVNIDSTGARGNSVLADAQTAPELFALASEAVAVQGGQRLTGHRVARAGDQSFWGIGVPAMFSSLGEQPASEAPPAASFLFSGPGKQGAGTGWWWHTPADTLDKMDEAVAVRDTRVYLHAVFSLLASSVAPLRYADHVARLRRDLAEIAETLGDRFDLGLLLSRAEKLENRCGDLQSRIELATDMDAQRINSCLMRISRALVPIDCTRSDRFDHDPALSLPAYPSLQPLRDMIAADLHSDKEKFLAVSARRGVNRVGYALQQAIDAIEQFNSRYR